ncbi:MAG: heavy-metal-associated domain-containing protein [Cellulosilyticum sp.]|nr:heavy-metal-associated domain-containing protein [Cellulosilyticum sp.]
MKRKIQIEGMSCNHCSAHVKEVLEALNGATDVEVNLAEKYALISGDVTEELIKEVIDDAGYDVVDITLVEA